MAEKRQSPETHRRRADDPLRLQVSHPGLDRPARTASEPKRKTPAYSACRSPLGELPARECRAVIADGRRADCRAIAVVAQKLSRRCLRDLVATERE